MPKSSPDGMHMITFRLASCPRSAPELASLWPPAVRPEHAGASLRSLSGLLGARPPGPLERWARSFSSPGTCTRFCGVNPRRAWCRSFGDHAWNGTYKQGKVCKAPLEEGGARMQQWSLEKNTIQRPFDE